MHEGCGKGSAGMNKPLDNVLLLDFDCGFLTSLRVEDFQGVVYKVAWVLPIEVL